MKNILVVDDDAEFRSHLTEVLEGEGYRVGSAASGKEALGVCRDTDFDVVLLDYMMPKMTGMDLLVELKRCRPRARIIMVTAFATVENAVEAIRKGASDYLSKPFKIPELLTCIRRVLEEARFEEGIRKLSVDQALGSIANAIRRNILKMLYPEHSIRLMEITRSLGIEDHTKVLFHLKLLKEANLVEQDGEKSYRLTDDGVRVVECLMTLEQMLMAN